MTFVVRHAGHTYDLPSQSNVAAVRAQIADALAAKAEGTGTGVITFPVINAGVLETLQVAADLVELVEPVGTD